jgi:hypothetical protein
MVWAILRSPRFNLDVVLAAVAKCLRVFLQMSLVCEVALVTVRVVAACLCSRVIFAQDKVDVDRTLRCLELQVVRTPPVPAASLCRP